MSPETSATNDRLQAAKGPAGMSLRIGFMAISQAHQYLHWLPAALRLAREPGVEVTVLGSNAAGLDFIRSYDPERRLGLVQLWAPFGKSDDLFETPSRFPVLALNSHRLASFPILVTTETTTGLLRRFPWFRSKLVIIKHGAGDREGSYNSKHALFDLILANGQKHCDGLVSRGLIGPERCIVAGNAKLEIIRRPEPIFADGKPLALYNPHFKPAISSWFGQAQQIVDAMEQVPGWNFVIAPHVRMRDGPEFTIRSGNVLFDRGSTRSIDMSYTQAADIYIGDVSSQVYEFLQRPRPCIFLNLERIDWRDDPTYAHWALGQVIESVDELGPALERAHAIQDRFVDAQTRMLRFSMQAAAEPASERQARAILEFARS